MPQETHAASAASETLPPSVERALHAYNKAQFQTGFRHGYDSASDTEPADAPDGAKEWRALRAAIAAALTQPAADPALPVGLRELSEAATPGEWRIFDDVVCGASSALGSAIAKSCGNPRRWPANRAFIVAAVNYVRTLAAASTTPTAQTPAPTHQNYISDDEFAMFGLSLRKAGDDEGLREALKLIIAKAPEKQPEPCWEPSVQVAEAWWEAAEIARAALARPPAGADEFAGLSPAPPADIGMKELRDALKELTEAADEMIAFVPGHWHDDHTIRLTDAAEDANKVLKAAAQDDLYETSPRPPAGAVDLPAERERIADAISELRRFTNKIAAGHPGLETPDQHVGWLDEGLCEIDRKLCSLAILASRSTETGGARGWQPIETAPRDATVQVVVVHRNPAEATVPCQPTTHPAYIDEAGRVCCPRTWRPDSGLHGPYWRATLWQPLARPPVSPAPAEGV